MLKSVIKQIVRAVGILILAVVFGTVIAYSSSMFILMLGLMEYGEQIMTGVFIAFVFGFIVMMYSYVGNKFEKKKEDEKEPTRRDYFRDGNFAF